MPLEATSKNSSPSGPVRSPCILRWVVCSSLAALPRQTLIPPHSQRDLLVDDRAAYISFLEAQVEHISKAALDNDALRNRVDALEEKLSKVAHLLQMTQAYSERQGREAGDAVGQLRATTAQLEDRLASETQRITDGQIQAHERAEALASDVEALGPSLRAAAQAADVATFTAKAAQASAAASQDAAIAAEAAAIAAREGAEGAWRGVQAVAEAALRAEVGCSAAQAAAEAALRQILSPCLAAGDESSSSSSSSRPVLALPQGGGGAANAAAADGTSAAAAAAPPALLSPPASPLQEEPTALSTATPAGPGAGRAALRLGRTPPLPGSFPAAPTAALSAGSSGPVRAAQPPYLMGTGGREGEGSGGSPQPLLPAYSLATAPMPPSIVAQAVASAVGTSVASLSGALASLALRVADVEAGATRTGSDLAATQVRPHASRVCIVSLQCCLHRPCACSFPPIAGERGRRGWSARGGAGSPGRADHGSTGRRAQQRRGSLRAAGRPACDAGGSGLCAGGSRD